MFAGSQPILRSQSAHPLDPLSPTEIAVAIATVRAAGETPEVSVKDRSLLLGLRVRFICISKNVGKRILFLYGGGMLAVVQLRFIKFCVDLCSKTTFSKT